MRSTNYLIFSGAGLSGVTFLGVMDYIVRKTSIGYNAKHIVGCSAGSIIALLYVLGIDPREAYPRFNDVNRIFDRNSFMLISRLLYSSSAGSSYGSIDTKEITDYVCDVTGLCNRKTFKELHEETGKSIYIVTTDVTTGDAVICSHLTYPSMPVIDAVAASCAIPFIFQCTRLTDDYGIDRILVDGGMSACYPLELVDPENLEHCGKWNGEAIGVTTIHNSRWIQPKVPTNITEYMSSLLNSLNRRIFQLQSRHRSFRDRTIVVDVGTASATEPLSEKSAKELYDKGYFAAESFFDARNTGKDSKDSADSNDSNEGITFDKDVLETAPIFRCHPDLGGVVDYSACS